MPIYWIHGWNTVFQTNITKIDLRKNKKPEETDNH